MLKMRNRPAKNATAKSRRMQYRPFAKPFMAAVMSVTGHHIKPVSAKPDRRLAESATGKTRGLKIGLRRAE
jgi:hypothetical protein